MKNGATNRATHAGSVINVGVDIRQRYRLGHPRASFVRRRRCCLLGQKANGKRVHRELAFGGLIGGAQDEDEVQVRPSAQADVPQRGHGAERHLCEDEQRQKIHGHRDLEIQRRASVAVYASRSSLADEPNDQWPQHVKEMKERNHQRKRRKMAQHFPSSVLLPRLFHRAGVAARRAEGKRNPAGGQRVVDFFAEKRIKNCKEV